MRLPSFGHPDDATGTNRCGVVSGGGLVDLTARLGTPALRALLAAGLLEAARDAAAGPPDLPPDLPLDGPRFAPVIPDPDKIICVGLNDRDHVAGTGRTVTGHPALTPRRTR